MLSSLVHDKVQIGEIVEIGTNVGLSAIALAHGLGELNKRIYTVDIYCHPQFAKNVQMAGATHRIEQLLGPSHVIASSFHSGIGLLFVDGDHSYRGVVTDIKAWSNKVVQGGYIIFDDFPGHKKGKTKYYQPETNNVGRAVQRRVERADHLRRTLGQVDRPHVVFDGELGPHRDVLGAVAVTVHPVLAVIGAGLHAPDFGCPG